LGVEAEAGEQVEIAMTLLVEQRPDTGLEPVSCLRRERAQGLVAEHRLEHVLLPLAYGALGMATKPARRAPEVLADIGEEVLSRRQGAPRGLGPLGGRLGVLEDQRLQA